jgi:multiple sugar transport system ATP-binding protein
MGRAIVREPQAFLMDEPLSNLDAKLRVQMRAEISSLQRRLGTTTIYVTHDQVEAMTMGHRVAVIRKGVLQQVASPQELYDRPVNVFVAGFIGSPAMNMLLATPRATDKGIELDLGATTIPLDTRSDLREHVGRELVVGIRPENIEDGAFAQDSSVRIPAHVVVREPLGSEVVVHLEVQAAPAVTEEVRELAADVGDDQAVARRAGAATATVVGRFTPRTRVKEGERIDVAVDTSALHVFDPESGMAIGRPTGGG